MSSSSGSTRRTFQDQVTVPGQYGTELVRRKDEPDVGYGKVHCVVTFDGVLGYQGDTYFGNISVNEDKMDAVVGDISQRVSEHTVVSFVEGDSDDGGSE